MSEGPRFDRDFTPDHGRVEAVSPLIRRIVARNPGPFTFTGTGTYIIGHGHVAVLDPGPDDPAHLAALIDALKGETITHILVSHTHLDHSAAAPALAAATGARTYGFGPHATGDGPGADLAFMPDIRLVEGDVIEGRGWRLETLYTPGHAANHVSFALPEENALFSGDHVMGWSTSVVVPPDGDMAAYMHSLETLRSYAEKTGVDRFWPTHGGPVRTPLPYLEQLLEHRRMRERAILGRLDAGDQAIGAIVRALYQDTPTQLHAAAALSVRAHLDKLAREGRVFSDEGGTLWARRERDPK